MIDTSKFEKLEKEDLQEVSGGLELLGVEYDHVGVSWSCVHRDKFTPKDPQNANTYICAHCKYYYTHGRDDSYCGASGRPASE